jgi:hypothetical protein
MAWTKTTRLEYERNNGRYASDLRDGVWELIVSFRGSVITV